MMNPGDTVYLSNGSEAVYMAAHGKHHLVRRLFETVDGEGETRTTEGQIEEWSGVFTEPPVAKVHAEVAALLAQRQALASEVGLLRMQKREAEADTTSLKARLQEHEALRRVDDFLAGRFEWVVVSSYGLPKVKPRDEALKTTDSYDRERYRLLTLYGGSKGDLSWHLNRYSDHSGNNEEVWLCFTEEEARQKVQALYDEAVAEWRLNPQKNYKARSWAEGAPEWLVVPEEVLALNLAAKEQAKAKRVAELEAELARVRAG